MVLDYLQSHKSKYPFEIDADDFLIKIAQSPKDIEKAQRLRHLIFLEEGLGKSHETGLDFDDFDAIADHLMIINKQNGEAVGTYRLISSRFSQKFYSQSEFFLDNFLKTPGIKLEMGRACTHSQFRNGRTMDLLWQGLAKYIQLSGTRFLFGCSSVNTTDPQYMYSLMKSLDEHDQLKTEFDVHPINEYALPEGPGLFIKAHAVAGYTKELPPLLRSYLHAGSYVYGMPAYDKDFLCFDLLTILDLTQLNNKFQARYFPKDYIFST